MLETVNLQSEKNLSTEAASEKMDNMLGCFPPRWILKLRTNLIFEYFQVQDKEQHKAWVCCQKIHLPVKNITPGLPEIVRPGGNRKRVCFFLNCKYLSCKGFSLLTLVTFIYIAGKSGYIAGQKPINKGTIWFLTSPPKNMGSQR